MGCGCGATSPLQSAGKKPNRSRAKPKKGGAVTRSKCGTLKDTLNQEFSVIKNGLVNTYDKEIVQELTKSVFQKNPEFASDATNSTDKSEFLSGMTDALKGYDIGVEFVPKCTMTNQDLPPISGFKIRTPKDLPDELNKKFLSLRLPMCKIVISLLHKDVILSSYPVNCFEHAQQFADKGSLAKYEFAYRVLLIVLKGTGASETQKLGHFWYIIEKVSGKAVPVISSFQKEQRNSGRAQTRNALENAISKLSTIKTSNNTANVASSSRMTSPNNTIMSAPAKSASEHYSRYTKYLESAFKKFIDKAKVQQISQAARLKAAANTQVRNAASRARAAQERRAALLADTIACQTVTNDSTISCAAVPEFPTGNTRLNNALNLNALDDNKNVVMWNAFDENTVNTVMWNGESGNYIDTNDDMFNAETGQSVTGGAKKPRKRTNTQTKSKVAPKKAVPKKKK